MQAGFIGLGAMGTGMARNLAKSGYLSYVYNRTINKAIRFAAEFDLQVARSAAALAGEVDVILLCVSADKDVLEVINEISAGLKPGTVVVDMSTVSNATAVKAAQILKSRQADFLDAPVSGGVEGAQKGTLAMMLGGDDYALEKVRPVLECMTTRIMHMGATGTGQSTKAVNQIMAAGINQAVTEALSFAEAQGLEMEKVIDVISGGAAGNWFLEHRGPTMTKGSFAPGFKLALHLKDLKICQTMARQSGVTAPLLNMTVADYEKLITAGFADEDISTLYRLKNTSN